MKALSIRQPWAWLIVNGFKPVENRTWESFYRGPLLIHAGKLMTMADYEACLLFVDCHHDTRIARLKIPQPMQLDRGGIVGRAVMTGCVREYDSNWFCGPFGFVLEQAKPLAFRPIKGQLSFFEAGEPE
jgi:ASCH domain